MTKVFLAEPVPQLDLTSAMDRGTLIYLTQRYNPLATQDTAEAMLVALQRHGFDPETDWICLAGRTATVAILCGAVSAAYSKLPLLVFDARVNNYAERTVHWQTAE